MDHGLLGGGKKKSLTEGGRAQGKENRYNASKKPAGLQGKKQGGSAGVLSFTNKSRGGEKRAQPGPYARC